MPKKTRWLVTGVAAVLYTVSLGLPTLDVAPFNPEYSQTVYTYSPRMLS